MDTSYIYLEGRHVSYLYLVWLLFLFIYDVTLISAILSETHYFTSLSNPVLCLSVLVYIILYWSHLKLVLMTVFSLIPFIQGDLPPLILRKCKQVRFIISPIASLSLQGKFWVNVRLISYANFKFNIFFGFHLAMCR